MKTISTKLITHSIVLTGLISVMSGCGSIQKQQTDVREQKSVPAKLIAGDDQHVTDADTVTLAASFTNHKLKLRRYNWSDGNISVSKKETFVLSSLGVGKHQLHLKAEDKFGRVYRDEVTVEVETKADNNTAPLADNQALNVTEDSRLKGAFLGSDSDGDSLQYLLVSLPKHGTLTGTSAHFTYKPDANFNGEDSFLYKLNDGKIDSNIAKVTITVNGANDVPLAKDMHIQTANDQVAVMSLEGEDIDKDALSFIIVDKPDHGTLSQEGEKILYTPQNTYSGIDLFSYKVNDGKVDSNIATVTIDVNSTNHVPLAHEKTVTTVQNQAIDVIFDGIDSDGDTLTYHFDQPTSGTLNGVGQTIRYTPQHGFLGSDSFFYWVNDGTADSIKQKVTINVTQQPNAKPTVTSQTRTLNEDSSIDITLDGFDSDGDTLTYSIVKDPTHGSFTMSGNVVHYTPYANYNGDDTFSYKVNDSLADSDNGDVTLHITPVNDAPIASAGSDKTITQGESVTFDGSDSYDADGAIATYRWKEGATVLANSASFSKSDFAVGTHTLTLEVTDGSGSVASDSVTLYVNAVQTNILIPKTGQQQVHYAHDDGYYQRGLGRNFLRDDVSGIVTDLGTGLMWMDDSSVLTKKKWQEADNFCKNSTTGGYTDWRLPQIQALYFLAKKDNSGVYESAFVNKNKDKYWSSDLSTQSHMATYVDFSNASENFARTESYYFLSAKSEYVRCVRSTPLEFTFTRDGNNMVIDSVHKLMWHDDSDAISKKKKFTDAIAYCEDMNKGGFDDWRLPNIHELYSIVDPAKLYPAFNDIFTKTKKARYWSSTSSTDGKIYTIDFTTGHEKQKDATDTSTYVRCVRDIP